MSIAVLAGGVGGSKFLGGLVQEVDPDGVTAIVNTGDDIELHGLHVSPDVDIVTYTLAGVVDPGRGWGLEGDTFGCLETLGRYGCSTWFRLGDRDLGTHLFRTQALGRGRRLTEIAADIRLAFAVRTPILPMTDDPVTTYVLVAEGRTVVARHFQEYLVQRGAAEEVRGVEYRGSPQARPTAEVQAALAGARAIIIAPSNPICSIGPILAIPRLRGLIRAAAAPVVALSPIVGGRSLKGPSDRFLTWAGVEVSPFGVASYYLSSLGRLDGLVIDRADEDARGRIEDLGVRVRVAETVMTGPAEKRRAAQAVLALLEDLRCPAPRS